MSSLEETSPMDAQSTFLTDETATILEDYVTSTNLSLDETVEKATAPIHRNDSFDENESILTEKAYRQIETNTNIQSRAQACISLPRRILQNNIVRKLSVIVILFTFFMFIKNALRPDLMHDFFTWMEEHPNKGIIAYTLLYPINMVLLLPGSPLVLGAGFIFKTQYGWVTGVLSCSFLTLFGSLLGSIICFLLGRYWIRETVRRWSRKYPMFDAIDTAVSDNGFKIMCYLYLTPVLPLAPASYMMGTTSMPLKSFSLAKIAALPNTMLHVYVGAATGTLFIHGSEGVGTDRFEEVSLSPKVIVFGMLMSIVTITLIGMQMKKELVKVLDKEKVKEDEKDPENVGDEDAERAKSLNSAKNAHTRQRYSVQKHENV